MVKLIISRIIQNRNKAFNFDSSLTASEILLLCFQYLIKRVRGIKYISQLKYFSSVYFGRGVKLIRAKNIIIGKGTRIEDNVFLSAIGKKHGIIIGNNCSIASFTKIICTSNYSSVGRGIKLGDNVGIGDFSYLGGAGGVEIGSDTIIGQYFSCHPQNHCFYDLSLPIRLQGTERKGIKIGENCWIGAKVTILDGVSIGDGCIVGAGSVVTKPFNSNVILAGVPAKQIGKR